MIGNRICAFALSTAFAISYSAPPAIAPSSTEPGAEHDPDHGHKNNDPEPANIHEGNTQRHLSAAGEICAVERFDFVRVVDAQRDDAEGKNHRDKREIGDDDQLEAHSFPL